MKHIKTKNPKYKLLFRKWIIDDKFDPYNPSQKLLDELDQWKTPSSNYIKKDCQGLSIGQLTEEVASYVAFEAYIGRPEIRLMAAIRYFILMTKDVDYSRQDVYDAITDREMGIIPEISADYLKPKKPTLVRKIIDSIDMSDYEPSEEHYNEY